MLSSDYPVLPAELTGNNLTRLMQRLLEVAILVVKVHMLFHRLTSWARWLLPEAPQSFTLAKLLVQAGSGSCMTVFQHGIQSLVVQAGPEESRRRRWLNCWGAYWGYCQTQWKQNILSIYFLKLLLNKYFPLYFRIFHQKRRQIFLAENKCSC